MVRFLSVPLRRLPVAAALGLAALTAQAQSAAPAVKDDPLDPAARVPAQRYESPFERYRGLRDESRVEPSKVWREANDTVRRIGGWRAYAREAQQPDPAAAATPAASAPAAATPAAAPRAAAPPASAPAPHAHGGHAP